LEDSQSEANPRVAAKLHGCNTVPLVRISRFFDSSCIRRMIRSLYGIFYNHLQFYLLTRAAHHIWPSLLRRVSSACS
jgi:hypothetical protein